jgi:hypothetical protein
MSLFFFFQNKKTRLKGRRNLGGLSVFWDQYINLAVDSRR